MTSPTTSKPPAYPPASLSAAAASSIDKPTLALIRRVLCSHAPPSQPLEDLLGPLTRSPLVDIQLYALLAIVCRDFIDSWYSKITNDQELIREIVVIVGAVVGALEERACKIDLELLLLDELPAVVENHIKDYRLSLSRTGTSIAPHLTTPQIFHNLQPHPALSSPSSEHLYNKILSSKLLSVLLPPSDLESNCSRTLIREILSTMVLTNTINKFSEPWMLHELITKLLTPTPPSPPPSPPSPPPSPQQPVYTAIRIPPALDSLLTVTTRILALLKTFLVSLLHTVHTPPPPPRRAKPILRMSVFRLIASYLCLPSLQPWLVGGVLLLSRPFTGRSNRVGVVLDGLLEGAVRRRVHSEEVVVGVLRMAREAVFPGNGPMGPPRAYPGVKEKREIRRGVEEAVVRAVPVGVRRLWFGDDEVRKVGELWLDVFESKEINKHLLYNVLDLVVGRLVPELVEVPEKG